MLVVPYNIVMFLSENSRMKSHVDVLLYETGYFPFTDENEIIGFKKCQLQTCHTTTAKTETVVLTLIMSHQLDFGSQTCE